MYKFSKFLLIVLLLLFSAQTIFAGRYYDSATGRWLSVDPKASKYPGWTSYNYALNNPLKYVDPDGKNPELAAAAAIVIGTGIVITATYLATKNYLAHPSAVNFPNQTNITTT